MRKNENRVVFFALLAIVILIILTRPRVRTNDELKGVWDLSERYYELNVRSGHSINSPVVGELHGGQITLTGREYFNIWNDTPDDTADWVEIESPVKGWIVRGSVDWSSHHKSVS